MLHVPKSAFKQFVTNIQILDPTLFNFYVGFVRAINLSSY